MKFITALTLTLSFTFSFGQPSAKYVGAKVYQSGQFIRKDFYVINGSFTFAFPQEVDTIISLQDKYVIPPFGDAHTHNLDREWQVNSLPGMYAKEGTIYALNLTSKLDGVKKLKPYFEKDSTIDVVYSLQGLTSTLGHPFMAYEPFAMGLDYEDWHENTDSIRKSRLDEGNSYIFLDNDEDVNAKLPSYFNENPDVVKIYLLHSEEYEERYQNAKLGDGGLSTAVAREVVERAHDRGLKVYAHIETAYDFEQAISLGVDYFAHMPGYAWDTAPDTKSMFFVEDSIIDLAVSKGVGVIPTIGPALLYANQDSVKKIAFVKDFLLRYKNRGGRILIGSDVFNKTLSLEIACFIKLGIFPPKELLDILCYETPRAIFPNRKIGEIKEDYEASFLVLGENPLRNINTILEVEMTVKQGFMLR